MKTKFILAILIIVLFIISMIILYFLARNYKLSEYNRKIKQIEKQITNNNSEFKIAIIRYEALSQNQSKYAKDLKNLKSIYENIKDLNNELKEKINSFKTNKSKYKSLACKREYNEIQIIYSSYQDFESRFKSISEITIKNWNQIDETSTKVLNTIVKLEEYINKNESKLKNSCLYLKKELNTLRTEIHIYENEKISNKIIDVNAKINDFQNKIKTYINKIDCMSNFEWTIYYNLEGLIQTTLTQNPNNKTIQKIRKEFNEFKWKWLTLPYQEVIAYLKNTYQNVYLIKNIGTNEKIWREYWTKEKIDLFIKNINDINSFIEIRIQNNNVLSKGKTKSNDLLKLFSEFKDKKNKTIDELQKNTSEIESIVELINISKTLLKHFDEFMNLVSIEEILTNFNVSIMKTYEFWYLYILASRDLLEKNMTNEELIYNFENSFNELKKEVDDNQTNFYDSEKLNKFIGYFTAAYKLIKTNEIYKNMFEETISKLIKKQKEHPELIEIINLAYEEIKKKNYKNGYETLSNFMKKRKINVQKNTN